MKEKSFLVAVVLLCSAGVPEIFGQVRTWVSPNGVDTAPCTRDQPCRNFAAAITAVAAGGEVIALTSAGYGPVTVTKSVAIISPEGVHAAIAPTSNEAIRVEAANTDRVVLRNLYLNSQGAAMGIRVLSVADLYVEKCTAANFINDGIHYRPTTTAALLFVNDTTVRQNGSIGIFIDGPNGAKASLDSVRAHRNGTGISSERAEVTIRRSDVAGNGQNGVVAFNGAKIILEDSVSAGNNLAAFYVEEAEMMLSRCAATSSEAGVRSGDLGIAWVSESSIVGNTLGVENAGVGGEVRSRGNNTLQENGTNGAFSSTFFAD